METKAAVLSIAIASFTITEQSVSQLTVLEWLLPTQYQIDKLGRTNDQIHYWESKAVSSYAKNHNFIYEHSDTAESVIRTVLCDLRDHIGIHDLVFIDTRESSLLTLISLYDDINIAESSTVKNLFNRAHSYNTIDLLLGGLIRDEIAIEDKSALNPTISLLQRTGHVNVNLPVEATRALYHSGLLDSDHATVILDPDVAAHTAAIRGVKLRQYMIRHRSMFMLDDILTKGSDAYKNEFLNR